MGRAGRRSADRAASARCGPRRCQTGEPDPGPLRPHRARRPGLVIGPADGNPTGRHVRVPGTRGGSRSAGGPCPGRVQPCGDHLRPAHRDRADRHPAHVGGSTGRRRGAFRVDAPRGAGHRSGPPPDLARRVGRAAARRMGPRDTHWRCNRAAHRRRRVDVTVGAGAAARARAPGGDAARCRSQRRGTRWPAARRDGRRRRNDVRLRERAERRSRGDRAAAGPDRAIRRGTRAGRSGDGRAGAGRPRGTRRDREPCGPGPRPGLGRPDPALGVDGRRRAWHCRRGWS